MFMRLPFPTIVMLREVDESELKNMMQSKAACSDVMPCRELAENTVTDRMYVGPDNVVMINGIYANIRCYRILNPNKVILVEFCDNSYEKMVLHKGDTYNLDRGLVIAIAKHVGRKLYNARGIENLADRLEGMKCIDKILHKAHVEYRRRIREAEKKVQQTNKSEEKQPQRRKLKITSHKHEENNK